MILFAIHITLNKSRNPNEGHGWRGALSTTQKIARGHWFRENLTPKLEKKSRQGGLPRCPDQKQVDTTSLVGKLSHVPWFPWFQTVLCFYSCSYKILWTYTPPKFKIAPQKIVVGSFLLGLGNNFQGRTVNFGVYGKQWPKIWWISYHGRFRCQWWLFEGCNTEPFGFESYFQLISGFLGGIFEPATQKHIKKTRMNSEICCWWCTMAFLWDSYKLKFQV